MLNHAQDAQRPDDLYAYRCYTCGEIRLKESLYKGEKCKKCGGDKFRKANPPWWMEIRYLISNLSSIKKSILWPSNWRDWRKYHA